MSFFRGAIKTAAGPSTRLAAKCAQGSTVPRTIHTFRANAPFVPAASSSASCGRSQILSSSAAPLSRAFNQACARTPGSGGRPFHTTAPASHGGIDRPAPGTGIKVTFRDSKGQDIKTVEANEGDDLLSVAHEYDIDLEGEFQSKCHVQPERWRWRAAGSLLRSAPSFVRSAHAVRLRFDISMPNRRMRRLHRLLDVSRHPGA